MTLFLSNLALFQRTITQYTAKKLALNPLGLREKRLLLYRFVANFICGTHLHYVNSVPRKVGALRYLQNTIFA
jgi:hypothetical protein